MRPVRPKYHHSYYALSGLHRLLILYQGRRASRLPLAIIFRAVGALVRLFVQSQAPIYAKAAACAVPRSAMAAAMLKGPVSRCRSVDFRTFPDAFLGSSATMTVSLGA